jgi:hypothetical protein
MRIIVGFQAISGEPSPARLRVAGLYTEEDYFPEFTPGSGYNNNKSKEKKPRRRHHVLIEEDDEEEDFPSSDPGIIRPLGVKNQKNDSNMGECSLSIIDHGLTRLFYWLGVKIGQNPSYYIIIPFFISLLFGTGLQQLRYVDDPEYLFSPVDGAAKTERLIVEEFFPMNYSKFHPSRFTRPGRFAR